MSNKIVAGALGTAVALGSFAALGSATFAAPGDVTGWQEVEVRVAGELELAGSIDSQTVVNVSLTTPTNSAAAGALTVKSNVAWKLQWQAVTGEYTDEDTDAATGVYLTASGFGTSAANASFEYAGGQTAAPAGANKWGAVLAIAGTGGSLVTTPTLGTAPSNVATGSATNNIAVTPTYSASTDGTITSGNYYGTIHYTLSANS